MQDYEINCLMFFTFAHLFKPVWFSMKKLIFSILFFTCFINCHSQGGLTPSKHNFQIEGRFHYGVFVQSNYVLKRYQSHVSSFELSLQRTTFGRQRWESLHRYPLIGMSVYYSNLGNNDELGKAIAVYPFINFHLNNRIQNSVNLRLGIGLGWLTNHYDAIENHHNIAIGSHINCAASIYLDFRREITKQLYFSFSIGLTHFSNGTTKTPNYGLNIIDVSGGLSWFLQKPNQYLNKKLYPELYKFEFDGRKWFSIEGNFGYAFKDVSQYYGTKHSVYSLSFDVLRPLSIIAKVGLGFDFVMDRSDIAVLNSKQKEYKNDISLIKPGITAVYEMILGNTSFIFNLGCHVFGADLSEGLFYQKLGIKYHFNEKIYAKIALTAHLARADYITYGIGYRLNIKYYKLWGKI